MLPKTFSHFQVCAVLSVGRWWPADLCMSNPGPPARQDSIWWPTLRRGATLRLGLLHCVGPGRSSTCGPQHATCHLATGSQFHSVPRSAAHRTRLAWWLRWKRICLQCRRGGFDPWVGMIPCRKKWQPTPIFLPGKSHGQRSLAGYSPWGHRVGQD